MDNFSNFGAIITEPAAVAALKEIYENNGPGDLEWDFSTPGQLKARRWDNRLEARDGALTGLNLNQAGLKGVLKLHGLATLAALTADGNDLTGIDFKDLPGLLALALRNNKISDLGPLAGLENLKILSCGGNPLPPAEKRKWSRPADQPGDSEAQFALGQTCRLRGPYHDGAEAEKWLRLAAEQGHPEARFELGHAYFWGGRGLPQRSKAEAFKWLRLAAEQGQAEAHYDLGMAYDRGVSVKKDGAEASKLFRLAAERGFARAQFELGEDYNRGEGVEKDQAEALKWYRLAAEHGDERGQYALGNAYRLGEGVEKDPAEAVKWYRLAAEQRLGKAWLRLGLMYSLGDGVEKDLAEAVKWYRRCAERAVKRGGADGQDYGAYGFDETLLEEACNSDREADEFEVGSDEHEAGKAEAAQGYRLAAGAALSNLGELYRLGQGVEKNQAEVVRLYRLAAELGDDNAQFNLGDAYRLGDGVEKDLAEAIRWYWLATNADRNSGLLLSGYSLDDDMIKLLPDNGEGQ